jgi:MFS family permease
LNGPRCPWLPLILLSLISLGLGAALGSAEVVTVAYTAEAGRPGLAGVVLAVWALGSLLAGLWYGSVHWRAPVERRLLLGTIALAVTLAPLPWADSILVLGVMLFGAGMTIAPTLVAVTACVEEWVPPQRLTEAITWTVTGLLLGGRARQLGRRARRGPLGCLRRLLGPRRHRHRVRPGRQCRRDVRAAQHPLLPQLTSKVCA